MKIEFADKSFLEAIKSKEPGKILISIQARDHENPLKKVTNSVEITEAQFKELLSVLG